MLEELKSMKAKLNEYHDELEGVSFGWSDVLRKPIHYDIGDYTGAAIDAISDLIGVLEKRNNLI